jgi:superfamily I DNA/RNA helicase
VATEETQASLIFIDTAGFDLWESVDEDVADQSKYNDGEAAIVCKHLKSLITAGVPPRQVAIITPYNAQVARLKDRLAKEPINCAEVEIGSGKWPDSCIFMASFFSGWISGP